MPIDVQEQAGKSAGLSERQSHSIILLRKKQNIRCRTARGESAGPLSGMRGDKVQPHVRKLHAAGRTCRFRQGMSRQEAPSLRSPGGEIPIVGRRCRRRRKAGMAEGPRFSGLPPFLPLPGIFCRLPR